MTDIEKKAREYAHDAFIRAFSDREMPWNEVREIFEQTFIAGAAYVLSKQWRDAEKEKPPLDNDVLTGYPYEHGHAVGYYDGEDWYMTENGRLIRPTHWMSIPPIPEDKLNGE